MRNSLQVQTRKALWWMGMSLTDQKLEWGWTCMRGVAATSRCKLQMVMELDQLRHEVEVHGGI